MPTTPAPAPRSRNAETRAAIVSLIKAIEGGHVDANALDSLGAALAAGVDALGQTLATAVAKLGLASEAEGPLADAIESADRVRADHHESVAMRAARAEGAAAARRAIERERLAMTAAPEPVDPLAHLRMIRGPGEIVAAEQRMSAADAADAPLTFAERRDVDEALVAVRFSTSSHAHAEAARAAKEWRFLKARNLSSLDLRSYVETSVRRWAERTPHADY